MELRLGDVQTTALIPLAVKANETLRKNARIKEILLSLELSGELHRVSACREPETDA
jgi:hypothetical protein